MLTVAIFYGIIRDSDVRSNTIVKKVYEILVPTTRNDGRPISARFHRIWDKTIMEISGGLTILNPSKGKWKSLSDESYNERMIPVRIVCDETDIDRIIDITMNYYEQEAVLAYVISNEVILKNRTTPIKVRSPDLEFLKRIRK